MSSYCSLTTLPWDQDAVVGFNDAVEADQIEQDICFAFREMMIIRE